MMHETNAEFETRDEENVVGIWAFGLIFIVLGGFAILYYLRYVLRHLTSFSTFPAYRNFLMSTPKHRILFHQIFNFYCGQLNDREKDQAPIFKIF